MRVIAGEARGRRLEALPGTEITRPTMDQVKEAMFSIVQFDLPGARVLDLLQFFITMFTASRFSSRKTHRAAPRLRASMPSWPLPA